MNELLEGVCIRFIPRSSTLGINEKNLLNQKCVYDLIIVSTATKKIGVIRE